eukprot:TRINITY_DN774_c0_g1_i1.p1 TRINITY_DN774_c0_g1~~TRINITY_DN774_c0_g1_i1.p1  ORF type:complete len:143 (+),score=52.60 TRINITY_DN774_c0_g1_i1:192-620(+)
MEFDSQMEMALIAFSQQDAPQLQAVHEQLLTDIARCGECCYDWNYVKPVLARKLDVVTLDYESTWPDCPEVPGENFHDQRMRLLETLDQFQGIPFTLQRLAELLTNPKGSVYTSTRRFMDALDKVLAVSTTIPQYSHQEEEA